MRRGRPDRRRARELQGVLPPLGRAAPEEATCALCLDPLDGDVQALRLALGPLLNQSKLELGGSEDGEITFRWAQPAEKEKETG